MTPTPRHTGVLAVAAMVALGVLLGTLAAAWRASAARDVEALTTLGIAVPAALVALVGLAVIGGVVLLFYRRVLADLAARDRDLELERQHAFHQEKMAALGALAAGVLNDIGNPIAAIDGYARAMLELAPPAVRGELGDPALILRETARLQLITRQISELAAPPASAAELLSLNDVVRSAMLLLHFDPRLAGVRIETVLDAQLPALRGTADRLLQLVMQLTVNAADAVLAGAQGPPLIMLKTWRDGDTLLLSIADNGLGMTPQVLQRAFEPRFTTKPAGRGTGLGLPLAQAIARQHGGEVALASAAGQGTTVTVRLALQPQAVAQEAGA